ncbi:helix-turn-helix domain-containing protein [Paenibacillus sp. 2KB_20]|uniref:helix-turn-helix domain-containing protein n=1 Tax=Paenibacillus sp. 2KB_20 TaxID=3232977 RepID=UPI003F970CB2
MGIAERIQGLMNEKGISAYKLSKETGVPYTTLTKILNKTTKNPQIDSLQLIANYFDKKVDYFTQGEVDSENEKSSYYVLTEKDEADIAKELERMMKKLEGDSGISYLGEPLEMDENDRELLRISFENSLRVAKQIAKKKFTPKKYRD